MVIIVASGHTCRRSNHNPGSPMANTFQNLQMLVVLEPLYDHARVAMSNGIEEALLCGLHQLEFNEK